MLPHPAAANPADVGQFCPNKSAAGVICNKPLDPKQHHCYGCRYGGGVDRRHAALGCLADIIQSHSGVKVFIEQEVPALTRVVNGRSEHARMDLVVNLNGSVTYLDVSIVAPFSCSPSLVSAASTKPGLVAKKRAEKNKLDRYPHINLVPFILETTSRPGPHARKFINYLLRDADNPPASHQGHMVSYPKCATQCHLQTTTHCRRYVTHGDHCHTQYSFYAPRFWLPVPCFRERTQGFQSQAHRSCAMWPCCDFTSSDDDEHNTDNNFLLLFADIAITPTLLDCLSEIDVLHIALGCRFALDIFTISQQLLSPITSHFLAILSSPHFKRGCYTRL